MDLTRAKRALEWNNNGEVGHGERPRHAVANSASWSMSTSQCMPYGNISWSAPMVGFTNFKHNNRITHMNLHLLSVSSGILSCDTRGLQAFVCLRLVPFD